MKRNFIRVLLGAASALAVTGSAFAQDEPSAAVEELIVTAQKREEAIQDVPIAVSAFSQRTLEEQRIDGGYNLQLVVPNLTFTRGGNGTPNFQIRGVGYQLVSTSGDAGVLVHQNNAPLVVSRIADAEFYDMERLEVLRGPQGTLYGRNATGGVVNVITAKPDIEGHSASIQADIGSYSNYRAKGHLNFDGGDMFAVRLAGAYLNREGYTFNKVTGKDIDGRDLWSTRLSARALLTDRLTTDMMWEHFDEDDTRNSGGKSLCISDPGPTSIGSTPVNSAAARNFLSRGCLQGSIYQPAAFGLTNSVSTFGGVFATLAGLTTGNVFNGQTTSTDLREASLYRDPEYHARNDTFIWNTEFELTDNLTASALVSYVEDTSFTVSGSEQSDIPFNATAVTPGGIYTDPQGGPGTGIRTLSYADNRARQKSLELRLQSSFDGPLNYNVGAFFMDLTRFNDSFVSTNGTNAFHQAANNPAFGFFDPTPGIPVTGAGHNYFLSRNPYALESKAVFGELYWQATDTVRVTGGLRHTKDTKDRIVYPILLFAPVGSNGVNTPGWNPATLVNQSVEFTETSGRLVVDWKPRENTLVYGSFSRGYKAGGFNAPSVGAATPPYDPELVNAYEVGTKNILFNGAVQFNVTGFYYDYEQYQFSQLEGLTARTSNADVEVKGLEVETVWQPTQNLRLNANLGILDTNLKNGSSINPFDRTQGDPSLTYLKSIVAGCVAPTAQVEPLIQAINAGLVPASALAGAPGASICSGNFSGAPFFITPSPGVPVDLTDHELPNSPKTTASLGVQYTLRHGDAWRTIFRADGYYQSKSYGSIFNGEDFLIKSWTNANASVIFRNVDRDLEVQLYVKNIADDDVIISYDTASEQVGLVRGIQVQEPRLFGIAVSKRY